MGRLSETQLDQARLASMELNEAMRPLRMLSSVDWPDEFRPRFILSGTLPTPDYASIDVAPSRELLASSRKRIDGDHVVLEWLRRQADVVEVMVQLLTTRGTKEFSTHSQTLFGHPSRLLLDRKTRVIDFARHMDEALAGLDVPKLVVDGYERFMDALSFADLLRPHLVKHFGMNAPEVIVTHEITAKAVAGPNRIRLRHDAEFSHRDIDQLLEHEALVHVATSMNGKSQECFPTLGRAHAGTTETQEGLAVFAEIMSGAMDPVRFRRLADRVIAIQMSLDGADFADIYQFYLERTRSPEDAYENTRRIHRGGLLTGGAPFTKDIVYLNGLLRVHNFMRTVVSMGRADLIRLLFVGKMDIEDIPAMAQLASSNRIEPPKYMPAWVKDLRFLVSYLAYSSFLNRIKLPGFQAYYQEELADVPVVWEWGA